MNSRLALCVCKVFIIIYCSARCLMNQFIRSLLPLLPFPPLARGDPIDLRRCQSLLPPRPETQAPGPPRSEYHHHVCMYVCFAVVYMC